MCSPGPANVHHVFDLYYEVAMGTPGPASVDNIKLDLYYDMSRIRFKEATGSPGLASLHHVLALY